MEQKNCSDCIYYVQHYKKGKTSFRTVFYGHCKRKCRTLKMIDKACKLFVQRNLETEKTERTKTIMESLSAIAQNLDELKEFLKNCQELKNE